MLSLSEKSALVVGVNQSRCPEVSEKLREVGAFVVEAMTVPQAETAMRQIRFEFVFVDFLGAGVGVLGFLNNIRAEYPESRVFVVCPRVDFHVVQKLQPSDLANLGFGNAPDSIGEVLSTPLAEANDREHMGGHGPVIAPSGATKPNDRQK